MADASLAAETFGDEKATRAWLAAVDWAAPASTSTGAVNDQAAQHVQREAQALRLDPDAVAAVLAAAGHSKRSAARPRPAGLSDRELDVLRLLARGLPDKQIAQLLVVSPRTVHHHVEHTYDKLGVSTRAAAALYAMQHELLGDSAAFASG